MKTFLAWVGGVTMFFAILGMVHGNFVMMYSPDKVITCTKTPK